MSAGTSAQRGRESLVVRLAKAAGWGSSAVVGIGVVALTLEPADGVDEIILLSAVALTAFIGATASGLLRDRIPRWLNWLAPALFAGLPAGVVLGVLADGPMRFERLGAAGTIMKAFTVFDLVALFVAVIMIATCVISVLVGVSRLTMGLGSLSRLDRRTHLWAAPSLLLEGLAILALLYGRLGGHADIAAAVAGVCIIAAAGSLLAVWPKMDEMTRAFGLEAYGWSFLILFFAAAVWAALRMAALAPALGAYEAFVAMNAVYLTVTLALVPKRYGQNPFAGQRDEEEDELAPHDDDGGRP